MIFDAAPIIRGRFRWWIRRDADPSLVGRSTYGAAYVSDKIRTYLRLVGDDDPVAAYEAAIAARLIEDEEAAGEGAMLALGRAIDDVEPDPALAERLLRPATFRERVRPLGDLGWLDRPAPKRDAVISYFEDGTGKESCFMSAGKVGMLVGAGGVGKSHLLVQMAIAVATGTDLLDSRLLPRRRGRVLLIFAEEDADEMHRRLKWAASKLDTEHLPDLRRNLYPVPMAGMSAALHRDTEDGLLEITELVTDMRSFLSTKGEDPWRLIVLDPASRFMANDTETDASRATRFVEVLETLAMTPDRPACLLSHHTNKGARSPGKTDQSAARGSSAFTDGVRFQMNLESAVRPGFDEAGKPTVEVDPDRCILRVTKTNYGRTPAPIDILREEEGYLRAWRPSREHNPPPKRFGPPRT